MLYKFVFIIYNIRYNLLVIITIDVIINLYNLHICIRYKYFERCTLGLYYYGINYFTLILKTVGNVVIHFHFNYEI